jgi:EAL and modified HD-GYP domain-containing signal transduction protein
MLSSLGDKPRELIKTSVVRARMCQILGEGSSHQYGTYFTTGLFSTLDAFLNCSMQTAMDLLPLTDDIREALLEGKGTLGRVLAAVLAFEVADWVLLDQMGLDQLKIASAYLDAIRWGEDLMH